MIFIYCLLFLHLVIVYSIYKISTRADKCFPLEDIGLFVSVSMLLYTVFPVISWLMQGGEYKIPLGRLYFLQPSNGEVTTILLYSLLFLLGVLIAYIQLRPKIQKQNYNQKLFIVPKSVFYSALFVLIISTMLVKSLEHVYGLNNYESYGELYSLKMNLPLGVAQFFNVLKYILTISLIVVFLKICQNIRRYKFFLYFFVVFVLISFNPAGSRGEFFLKLLTFVVLWHILVKPISKKLVIFGFTLGLVVFLVMGMVRGRELNQINFSFSEGLPLGEFDIIYSNAIFILQEKNNQMLNVPFNVQVNDFIAFIPSNLLPFQKYDFSNWYLDNYFPEFKQQGGGLAFGLVPQMIASIGILGAPFAGYLLAIISMAMLRYTRKYYKWWFLAFYTMTFVSSYNIVRFTLLAVFTSQIVFFIFSISAIYVISRLIKKRSKYYDGTTFNDNP